MRKKNIIFRRHVLRLVAAALVAFSMRAAQARDIVPLAGYNYAPGSIVISTGSRALYYVLGNGQAIRYPVGVGKAGMAWHGNAFVALKRLNPAWSMPPEFGGGPVIPGGSPRNPMGAAVLGLDHGNYAIHGTNDPSSIGGYVSHGCIRMHNEDILDLYRRVPMGTDVYVTN
jgi:lipoprotein-anchoring transpeptidase ErfK/SrfK